MHSQGNSLEGLRSRTGFIARSAAATESTGSTGKGLCRKGYLSTLRVLSVAMQSCGAYVMLRKRNRARTKR